MGWKTLLLFAALWHEKLWGVVKNKMLFIMNEGEKMNTSLCRRNNPSRIDRLTNSLMCIYK